MGIVMNEQRIVTAQQTEKESSLNKFCEFASATRFLFVQVRNPIFLLRHQSAIGDKMLLVPLIIFASTQMAHKHRPVIRKNVPCKVYILIPREINPAVEQKSTKEGNTSKHKRRCSID